MQFIRKSAPGAQLAQKYDTTFRDFYLSPVGAPTFCYRTGLTVYEESFAKGQLVSAGWNAAGYPLDLLSQGTSRLNPNLFWEPSAFRLSADGCDLTRTLDYLGCDKAETEKETTAQVHLRSTIRALPFFGSRLVFVSCSYRCAAVNFFISCGTPFGKNFFNV